MRAYSASALTKDSDRLVALHGVAMKVQKVLKCQYMAGLWARNIEGQLAWKVVLPSISHRPSEYVAPSWSWASVVGEVSPMPQWAQPHTGNLKRRVPMQGP